MVITGRDLKSLGVKTQKNLIGKTIEQLALTEPWLLRKMCFITPRTQRMFQLVRRAAKLVSLGNDLGWSRACDRCTCPANPGYVMYHGALHTDFSLFRAVYCLNCAEEKANREGMGFFPFQIKSAWRPPQKVAQRLIIKMIRELAGLYGPVTRAKAENFFRGLYRPKPRKGQQTLF